MTVENLEKELKSGTLGNLYLLYGEETFLLETAFKKIKKLFGESLPGINYIQIEEPNFNSIADNINTPAFGYEKKLIVLKNLGLFKRKTKGAETNPIQGELGEYIEKNIDLIKETSVLLIVETSEDSFPAKNSKLLRIIEENGTACNFERLKPVQIISRLKGVVAAYGVKVDDSTLKHLIEISGTSMQVLINEIRKLIEYAGKNGTITKKDVDKLATKQLESVIFDLTDNLGKKEIKKSLDILQELLYNKEPIQRILITLYNHFKKLYIVKLAQDHNRNSLGKDSIDITSALKLKPNQMFLISKYKGQAEYFETSELRQLLEELIKLDNSYKIRTHRC
ncbi:MAG: DNA polymerase III subunit delta [Oscillospiraceae bacterium]|nr:DNA polymerase III subunit delta [Oscillospiraceae bacterium]